jgi:hypothetical protein
MSFAHLISQFMAVFGDYCSQIVPKFCPTFTRYHGKHAWVILRRRRICLGRALSQRQMSGRDVVLVYPNEGMPRKCYPTSTAPITCYDFSVFSVIGESAFRPRLTLMACGACCPRISDAFSFDNSKGSEQMNLGTLPTNNIRNPNTAYDQRVSDE